jgi:hypothetical protein
MDELDAQFVAAGGVRAHGQTAEHDAPGQRGVPRALWAKGGLVLQWVIRDCVDESLYVVKLNPDVNQMKSNSCILVRRACQFVK